MCVLWSRACSWLSASSAAAFVAVEQGVELFAALDQIHLDRNRPKEPEAALPSFSSWNECNYVDRECGNEVIR